MHYLALLVFSLLPIFTIRSLNVFETPNAPPNLFATRQWNSKVDEDRWADMK